MDVDTDPAAEVVGSTEKRVQASNPENQASAVPEALSTAARPVRPKAMTRRRR